MKEILCFLKNKFTMSNELINNKDIAINKN